MQIWARGLGQEAMGRLSHYSNDLGGFVGFFSNYDETSLEVLTGAIGSPMTDILNDYL